MNDRPIGNPKGKKIVSDNDELILRADARKNRERILRVAVEELTRAPNIALSLIAKKAGVGQGTFYRHFSNREDLVLGVYQHEMSQVALMADTLLGSNSPREALRSWMNCLAEYAMTKAGLAKAIQQASSTHQFPGKSGYAQIKAAAEKLLRANESLGTIRQGVTTDDFFLAIAGIWQIDSQGDWQLRLSRLMDLVMDGLCAGCTHNEKDTSPSLSDSN